MFRHALIAAAVAACFSLVACGGGGSDDVTASNQMPSAPSAPKPDLSTVPGSSSTPDSPTTPSTPTAASLQVLADTKVPVSTSYAMAADATGRLYLSYGSNVLAAVETDGTVHILQHNNAENFCSGRFMVDGALEVSACFEATGVLAFDADGNLYIDDWAVLRKALAPDLTVGFFASLRPADGSKVSPGASIKGLAVDAQRNVYVAVSARPFAYPPADGKNNDAVLFIRKFSPDGAVLANQVLSDIGALGRMGIDDAGNLFIVSGTLILRRVPDGTGSILTYADLGSGSELKDIAVDTDGTVYVADSGHQSIRKIAPEGTVSDVMQLDSHPLALTLTAPKRFALVTDKTNGDSYTIYTLAVP